MRQKGSFTITALAFTHNNIIHLLLIANNNSVASGSVAPQRQKGNLTLTAEMTQGPPITQKETGEKKE